MPKKSKTNIEVEADASQMNTYKRFFHGNSPTVFRLLPESKACKLGPSMLRGQMSKCRQSLLAANGRGAGVFMAINTVDGTDIVDAAVTEINAVFIDADGTMELSAIKKLKPHLIVQSSRGKFHAFWLVSGLQPADFKRVQRALAEKFGTDPSVCNPARVMRVAGTVHRKGKPVLSKIVSIKPHAGPVRIEKLLTRLKITLDEQDEDRPQTAVDAASSASASEIETALSFIPVANDRPTWLKIGMAIHSAMPDESGFEIWTAWSKTSSKYDAVDQRKNWRSFDASGSVGAASLFWLARRNGCAPPPASSALTVDEFALVDEFGRQVKNLLRFDTDLDQWLVFQSHVWVADQAQAVQAARVVMQAMRRQAKTEGGVVHNDFKKYASVAGIRSLLRDATATPALNARAYDFDIHPNLLAVANGVIDLRTGVLRPGLPEDMLKTAAPTIFDSTAECPKFRAFIRFFTRKRPKYAAYLQRALGYTLFGHTNEQVFFIALGKGGNGKGTLFRMMMHVLGKALVKPIPANLLTRAYAGNANGSTEAIMALNGPRMVTCGEGEGGKPLDGAFVKQLSGSDAFSARGNHGRQTEFTPTCKLWLAINELPDMPHDDDAIWRRVVLLPCDAVIENRDGAFEDGLKTEASGILNWLIEGARLYGEQRLGESLVVANASARARKQFDSVASWITDRCEVSADATVEAGKAAGDYRAYCRQQGRTHLSPQKFPRAMVAKGYLHRKTNGNNVYEGLCLKGA